jgi:hypothetical protein
VLDEALQHLDGGCWGEKGDACGFFAGVCGELGLLDLLGRGSICPSVHMKSVCLVSVAPLKDAYTTCVAGEGCARAAALFKRLPQSSVLVVAQSGSLVVSWARSWGVGLAWGGVGG